MRITKGNLWGIFWIALFDVLGGFPMVGILLFVVCAAWLLVTLIVKLFLKENRLYASAFGLFIMLILEISLCLGVFYLNKTKAAVGMKTITTALNLYKKKDGKYPERLQMLTPQYIPSVPKSKYVGLASDFWYSSRSHQEYLLGYTAFGMLRFYCNEKGECKHLD